MNTETTTEPAKPRDTPLQTNWKKLLFSVRRTVRYHTRRRAFFERIGYATKFLSVISGSATGVTAIIGKNTAATAWFGFFTAAFSSIDLIIGHASKARQCHDLTRKFIDLEKDMFAMGENPSEQDLVEMTKRRLTIEADEPPKLCLLDLVCHNEVLRAHGYEESLTFKLPFFRTWLCQFHDFDHTGCKTRADIAAEAKVKAEAAAAKAAIPSRA